MKKLTEFWVNDQFDLRTHAFCTVAGSISLDSLKTGIDGDYHHRPREPIAPEKGRMLPPNAPAGLKALYNLAAGNIRSLGVDPDGFYLYTLVHAGMVEPESCLRAGFWHFDLIRNLRAASPENSLPVSIGYSVSTCLPTRYITRLTTPENMPLPARKTVGNDRIWDELGETALKSGLTFQPEPGQVVRYDTLTLHRGETNTGTRPVHRIFMHIAFSPLP